MKEQVVEERKIALAGKIDNDEQTLAYMNELVSSFNIFDDRDIIEFIQMKGKLWRTRFPGTYK